MDPFICTRCGERAEYHGRVSAPPHTIYKCTFCRYENWWPASGSAQQQQQQQKPPAKPKSDT